MAKSHTRPVRSARRLVIEATYRFDSLATVPLRAPCEGGIYGRPGRYRGMRWLAECSVAALREALGAVAPERAGYSVTVPGSAGKQDPLWHSGCVPAGDRLFVKFAWSRPAALRLAREIAVLAALAREPEVPFLPEVVASSTDPC